MSGRAGHKLFPQGENEVLKASSSRIKVCADGRCGGYRRGERRERYVCTLYTHTHTHSANAILPPCTQHRPALLSVEAKSRFFSPATTLYLHPLTEFKTKSRLYYTHRARLIWSDPFRAARFDQRERETLNALVNANK